MGDWLGEQHIEVTGKDLSALDNEPGGHRIQRVPPTERKGRVHTSTVTVAVIDPDVPTFELDEQDLKVEWYSGTGAGGQHRNKHQNSCRITHIQSGMIATAQCRSRESSYTQALNDIRERVDSQHRTKYNSELSENRKEQVGSGMRGDKIRTYRFQDDRVQDHVTGKAANCGKVMRGHFDLLW